MTKNEQRLQIVTQTIRQDSVNFSVNYKVQTTWGFQEALTFVLEGFGPTLFFLSFLVGHIGGMFVGVLALGASGFLLLMHLGNPKNMVYVLANIRHSWMSRGAALIPVFIGLGFIVVAAKWMFGVSPEGVWKTFLIILFLLLMIFILLKSGLVMTTFPAIAFWNGSLLPMVFALSSLTSGIAVFAVFDQEIIADFFWLQPALLAFLLLAVAIYLVTMKEVGRTAKVSVTLIRERHFASFYGGGVAIGIVLPLALGIYIALVPSAASLGLWSFIAITRVAGDIIIRDTILKVGVFDKVL